MELRCPACGNAHNTEDYPGAFEIQCSCGYSILVPDEQSLSENIPVDDTHGFKDAPMAFDSEEEANRISVEADTESSNGESSHEGSHVSSLGMTDPEELPEEMPYDPFELNTESSDSDEESFPSFEVNDISETGEGFGGESFEGEASMDGSVEVGTFESDSSESGDEASTENSASEASELSSEAMEDLNGSDASLSPAQEVVAKVQWASLGQTRGSLFSIVFSSELSGVEKAGILDSLEDGLILSPWLKDIFSLSRNEIEEKISQGSLSEVPELLALQIYIHCLEKQISCEVSLAS